MWFTGNFSLTLSIYTLIFAELLISSFEEVISAHSTRFESTSKWREAHFGSHPRQIIFSDPTVIQMYDMRVSLAV